MNQENRNGIENIYFDMDGVLADFDNGVRKLCHMEPVPQNMERDPGYDDELWAHIRQVPHFYDLLDPEVVVHTVLREEASGTGILYLDAEKTMESINALEKNLS